MNGKALIEDLRDDDQRARFVETLRASASVLDGSMEKQFGAGIASRVSFELASRLRDAAQRLCDHVRMSRDGTCRYCELSIE